MVKKWGTYVQNWSSPGTVEVSLPLKASVYLGVWTESTGDVQHINFSLSLNMAADNKLFTLSTYKRFNSQTCASNDYNSLSLLTCPFLVHPLTCILYSTHCPTLLHLVYTWIEWSTSLRVSFDNSFVISIIWLLNRLFEQSGLQI